MGIQQVLASLNSMATQGRALRFDPAMAHHVDHGYFWGAGVDFTTFYWDYFVRPTQVSALGYVISAGYGSEHNLLSGFNSGTTHAQVTGNIWNGSGATSFASDSIIPLGDWVHVAVVWDLTNILVYVNGVCEAVTPYAAVTRSTPYNYDTVLYVGGSTHLNGGFDLKWVRGFEGVVPLSTTYYQPFRPERYPRTYFNNNGSNVNASFACDYTIIAETQADISNGLNGINHNGRRAIGGDLGDFQNASVQIQNTFDDSLLPQWVNATVNAPTEATTTVPVGAKIYDDFNRTSSPFWDNSPTLGSTEGGSLGQLAWQGAYIASYGCSYGRAYATDPSFLPVYVDSGSQTQDVRVSYTENQHVSQIIFRYTDVNNFMKIQADPIGNGTDTLYIVKRVAGVETTIASPTTGANTTSASELRVTISGNQIDVYYDGVSQYSGTGTSLPTGTGVGFAAKSGNIGKPDSFTAY